LRLVQSNIRKLIEEKAEELGFVKIGFAKADVLQKESDNLKLWLDKGYDADMVWIKKGFDKRKDVKLITENAKSVISLAYNYYSPFEHDETKPKISRYAWGKDYHKIIKKKLKELCDFIENKTPLNPPFSKGGKAPAIFKYYVDDGPVMDKAWAARAGIGWIGKHTNIINPEYGSWLFLSEIITNLEFETYDSPIEDLCGSCRICIDACPTSAIVDEYVLDSNLCISYQTIENRGEIPYYIDFNGWVFGCDVCQDVCPFNKNDKPAEDKSFYPKEELRTLLRFASSPLYQRGDKGGFNKWKTKAKLEAITEEEFDKIFFDSPVRRTKLKGWIRNLRKT
jgi:epoxyqueuosine reductase